MIYADNAATTKLDKDAYAAMQPFLLEAYGNASQPYSFSRVVKAALKEARQTIASCINAAPEEIFFTSGGTESDNWAIKGPAFADARHRATITSNIEHKAVLNACHAIARMRYPVSFVQATREGIIAPEALERTMDSNTRLVSVMLINNEIGALQPIKELCAVAHARGCVFHTDAVQALGHIPVDVQALGVDLLSASAHKFNGPRGVGFLYIRKGTGIVPYADGGAQEFGLRAGTENTAAIVGMATALQKNCADMAANAAHLQALDEALTAALTKARVNCRQNGKGVGVPGILSLSFRGADGETLLHRLDFMGICVSTGSACDSEKTRVSHVLQAIGLPPDDAMGTLRISFGRDNTLQDAQAIASAIIHILGKPG